MQFSDLLVNDKHFKIEQMTYQKNVSMATSHYHSHYEILYIGSGSRILSINNSKHIELNPNNIALLPPNIIHYTKSNSEIQNRVLINISSALIKQIIDFSSYNITSGFDTMILPLSAYDIKSIRSYFQQLIFIQNEPNVYLRNEKIKITLSALLLELSDINYKFTASNNPYKEPSEKLLNLDSVIDYISSHYYEDINLDTLAKKTTMSKQHFIRSFTKKYKTTPIKYLNSFRITTAQRLLESNTMNVSNVSKSCGFNNSTHFSRAFKEVTGMSPKEYQLKFKKK